MNTLYDHIEYVICAGEEIPANMLKVRTRKTEVCFTRQLIMTLATELGIGTYSAIASRYGLDHATINNAKKVIDNYYRTDRLKREKIQHYRDALGIVNDAVVKIDALTELYNSLNTELSDLEHRYLNLKVLVDNLKTELIELK